MIFLIYMIQYDCFKKSFNKTNHINHSSDKKNLGNLENLGSDNFLFFSLCAFVKTLCVPL